MLLIGFWMLSIVHWSFHAKQELCSWTLSILCCHIWTVERPYRFFPTISFVDNGLFTLWNFVFQTALRIIDILKNGDIVNACIKWPIYPNKSILKNCDAKFIRYCRPVGLMQIDIGGGFLSCLVCSSMDSVNGTFFSLSRCTRLKVFQTYARIVFSLSFHQPNITVSVWYAFK